VTDWSEYRDEETGAKCWRRCFSTRVRGHITLAGGLQWCVSRRGELPVEWFPAESLELAKRAAEDFAEHVPDVGPVMLMEMLPEGAVWG